MEDQQNSSQNYSQVPQPPQSTPPSSPIPPQTIPNIPPQSSPLSSIPWGKLILIGLVFTILIVIMNFFSKKSSKTISPGVNFGGKLMIDILPDYNTDTDKDGYSDFVETENGFDPKVSEYDSCKKNNCDDAQLQQTKTKHNVLIILDDSGSMQLGGTPTRMEIAKQAIKSYVSKASSNTDIGLMIYGHKGSNSEADKAISCVSAETISSLGTVNNGTIDGLLNNIKPVGWTPMGYALQQAALTFTGKEGQNNEVILLTDGEETCNSNPTGQAASLKSSSLNIKINIIGFAVDANAQTQLNQISTSGGGSFSTANNLTELDQKFNDLYENGLKLLTELKCKGQGLEEFRACYRVSFQKITDWVNKRKLTYYEKKISQKEYDILDSLNSKLYKQYNDVTSRETQNLNQDYEQKIQQIRGE